MTTFLGFGATPFQAARGPLCTSPHSAGPLVHPPHAPRIAPSSMRLVGRPGDTGPGGHLPFVHRMILVACHPRLVSFSISSTTRRSTWCASPIGHLGFRIGRVGQQGGSSRVPHPGASSLITVHCPHSTLHSVWGAPLAW